MSKIYRCHYRAQLQENYEEGVLCGPAAECVKRIEEAQRAERVLTAALYRHERMLFFYYEAIGEELETAEPYAIACGKAEGMRCESGEDIQADIVPVTELLAPLSAYLMPWPGQEKDRLWVHMYHIYCHEIPETVEGWKRTAVPDLRRGRIAFLREEKLFSYVYYHKAIVDEGLLLGDRYQSIALHENILFSYFEEPKTTANVRKDFTKESEVIKDWMKVDPESHFIHVTGEKANFMFLPALFAVGVEDLA